MTIKAKFPGKCFICGDPVAVGDEVEWAKGKGVRHPLGDCACALRVGSRTLTAAELERSINGVTGAIEKADTDDGRQLGRELLDVLEAEKASREPGAPRQGGAPAPLTPGVYEKDGEIYVVKPNKDKTRLYAKRLVEVQLNRPRVLESGDHVEYDCEFEYARGVIYDLAESDRMPLDRAKLLAIRYGRCISCGRTLKARDSVERGIGPVCVKSFALAV